MLSTRHLGSELTRHGFGFYTGVPCSYLKYLINYAVNEGNYVAAANEGQAVAFACGTHLGGTKSVVLMQNSGLANAVSPLTSLCHTFEIPVLGFVGLRGEAGTQDEPQHELMGEVTTRLLELLGIEWSFLSGEMALMQNQVQRAADVIARNRSYFFIVRKGILGKQGLAEQQPVSRQAGVMTGKSQDDELPTRLQALRVISGLRDGRMVQLATTGRTGRELCEVEDAPNNLYMVGSMGCVGSLGLGLALAQPEKAVVAIDGDGALLMHMGGLATIGRYGPENMLHVVLDNGAYDSTGGQATVSSNVDFVAVAAACGYSRSVYVHNTEDLADCIKAWRTDMCLTFLYLRIRKGSKRDLGRPSVRPREARDRLERFLVD